MRESKLKKKKKEGKKKNKKNCRHFMSNKWKRKNLKMKSKGLKSSKSRRDSKKSLTSSSKRKPQKLRKSTILWNNRSKFIKTRKEETNSTSTRNQSIHKLLLFRIGLTGTFSNTLKNSNLNTLVPMQEAKKLIKTKIKLLYTGNGDNRGKEKDRWKELK